MARSARISEIHQIRQKDNSGAGQARFDRLTDESAKAYQAFTIYRDLPVQERSLAIVSHQLGKNKSLCARWSTKFHWVDRANAWDNQQDQIRRTRMAAEREKIRERQLQNSRVASQALMAPLIALVKLTQSNADAFSGASATELAKLASWAARTLPRMHEEERTLAARPDESAKQDHSIVIAGAEFSWSRAAAPADMSGTPTITPRQQTRGARPGSSARPKVADVNSSATRIRTPDGNWGCTRALSP